MHSSPGCIRPKMHFARIHSTAECKDPMPGPWATHRPGLCAAPSEPSAASPLPPGLASLGPMSPAHGRVFVDAYICAFECQLRLHDCVDYVHAFACMYVFKCMLCMHALHASCTRQRFHYNQLPKIIVWGPRAGFIYIHIYSMYTHPPTTPMPSSRRRLLLVPSLRP